LLPLAYHLWAHGKELAADRHYAEALKFSGTDPKKFVDGLAKTLTLNDRHPDANSAYAAVLASFRQFDQAMNRLERGFRSAPNLKPYWIQKSEVFFVKGEFDSAYHYAAAIQKKFPYYLPTLKILLQSQARLGNCRVLDSLKQWVRTQTRPRYPKPKAEDYSEARIQERYATHSRWNRLQRKIGGEKLRTKHHLRVRTEYAKSFSEYEKTVSLLKMPCLETD
jgi:tetratricopeptide (TPR) repeat protein